MNTLLVVEDEKLIRQGIVAMIRRSSVPVEEILECRNGEEALEILRKQRVDVMFTDIRMPKMDGLTLVNKMEELSQKPVVIVLSGYDEFSYAVEMMKHGVRDYILKPIKRETIEQLLENLERELSETRETEEEEERCFLNQLRYLMMNAEMAEEKEWMDMESRLRRHIGNDSFRILLTSKANGERFSKCSGILLEGVEGGVLYLLPEPEAERIMKEKDERFCLGVGKEHRSVMEIPEAYQEALLAREMAFIQKNPVEEYQKKCFEEKPELAQFQEKFILQVPTDRADTVLRKMRNWYFEAAHQRVSPYQLLTVTEAICKELDLFYRMPEKQEKCPRPLQYRDADLFLDAFEEWIHVYRESLKSQTAGKEKMEEAISYIRENYAKDLNMAMVSNHICMNYSLFSAAFKEHTGVNFVNYLKDIRDVKLKDLRDEIGIVQQDVYLFAGTIIDNIRYGRPDATDEEVIRAAKAANAHEFIMELADGYDTDIGQRGVKLSGGQKQRLSIARVFLKNPPILIFDEATSALDNESEKVVQKSLELLAKDRTTFVIAHRLSTIRNAKRILVLTENGIAEEGTHKELLAKGGIYAHLYEMQF